jgi:AcrR family transcriptional regulator
MTTTTTYRSQDGSVRSPTQARAHLLEKDRESDVDICQDFGRHILRIFNEIRLSRGFTLTDLAAEAGMSRATLARKFRDGRPLYVADVTMLSAVLGVDGLEVMKAAEAAEDAERAAV